MHFEHFVSKSLILKFCLHFKQYKFSIFLFFSFLVSLLNLEISTYKSSLQFLHFIFSSFSFGQWGFSKQTGYKFSNSSVSTSLNLV